MPVDRNTGRPVSRMQSISGTLLNSPDAIFQAQTPTRFSISAASTENGELRNCSPCSSACCFSPIHCDFGELHALPVVVPGGVLEAEFDAPRLGRRAFRGGDVGLKLDGVGAGAGNRVDVGVRRAQAAVVGLGHLGHHQASFLRFQTTSAKVFSMRRK